MVHLYKIVFKYFLENNCMYICNAIRRANLTTDERNYIKEHFKTQKPSELQYTEFYNEESFNKGTIEETAWFLYDTNDCTNLLNSKPYLLRIKLFKTIINNLETK